MTTFSRVNTLNLVPGGTKVGEGFSLHEDELDVLLGYINTLNVDCRSISAPDSPVLNERWIDTSTNPAAFKVCTSINPVAWTTVLFLKANGGMVLSGGVTKFSMGLDANKVSSAAGVVYLASDTRILYMDTGTAFVPIGGLIRSATAPTNPVEGMEWLDTTTYTRKIYLSGAWVPLYATYAP
ncbi:hypothetical protein [Anaeromusa sp.]|uniref:hypothetical protein n=1 Tax=Anaeromusa sp. TaxID=1872520 RepID=UPI0026030CAE|nr:hypothetical protein [Anaeromusa sp.]MDD3157029.1 hypothetical protein [Anaeromusa sp.]